MFSWARSKDAEVKRPELTTCMYAVIIKERKMWKAAKSDIKSKKILFTKNSFPLTGVLRLKRSVSGRRS